MKIDGKNTLFMFFKGKSFEHKGDYDATAIYQGTSQISDCVLYNGASYYCKKTTTAGIDPTDTEYWGVMATSGVDADIINFAKSEMQKSAGEDGTIVHKKELDNVVENLESQNKEDINILSMLPSDNRIEVTVEHDSYYQAPVSGYFTLQTSGTYQSIVVSSQANNTSFLIRTRSTRPSAGTVRDFVPVRKGQYVFTEFGGTLSAAMFIPTVGV